jgi:acyl dehydratase
MPRYLDDFQPGDVFESPPIAITEDDIIAFAREFDPQPMHLDRDGAREGAFGRLVGSGWHTAALTMRLLLRTGMDVAGGTVGGGVEQLRWPRPLEPGVAIHVRVEVLEVRVSRSKPDRGVLRSSVRTLRDDGEAVQEMTTIMIVPRRPA